MLIAILFLLAGRVLAQASKPFIVWTQPIPITFPGEINGVQLNAIALSGPPVPVSLSSSYNIMGITTDGFQFAGGFDGSGWAYSETTLGAPVMWQGMTFPLGPANQLDVITSTTIPLPAGSFAKLLLLGDIVNNILPPVAQFIVTYTDGTSTSFLQSMSDWVNPRNYPGESVVDCAATRHFFNGTNDANSACIYGYSLSLDPAKVVQSIALPQNRNVLILSAVLVPPVLPGSFVYTPSSGAVPLPGTTNLGTVFTPSNPQAYSAANASVPLVVNAPTTPITPTINWPPPQPIVYRTPLTARQLNASASTPVGPVIVPLSGDYRVNAFYPDGAMYHETGFDGTFIAFSANQLGASLKYATSTFPLGPAAVPNAATSSTISLPSGSYSQLYLIGAGANGSQLNQTFTVTYTDGTQTDCPAKPEFLDLVPVLQRRDDSRVHQLCRRLEWQPGRRNIRSLWLYHRPGSDPQRFHAHSSEQHERGHSGRGPGPEHNVSDRRKLCLRSPLGHHPARRHQPSRLGFFSERRLLRSRQCDEFHPGRDSHTHHYGERQQQSLRHG